MASDPNGIVNVISSPGKVLVQASCCTWNTHWLDLLFFIDTSLFFVPLTDNFPTFVGIRKKLLVNRKSLHSTNSFDNLWEHWLAKTSNFVSSSEGLFITFPIQTILHQRLCRCGSHFGTLTQQNIVSVYPASAPAGCGLLQPPALSLSPGAIGASGLREKTLKKPLRNSALT